MDDLASKIKTRRKALGLTQDELAHQAGMATVTYQNYESGKRSFPSKILPRIAEALSCAVVDLYMEPTDAPKDTSTMRDVLAILLTFNELELSKALGVLESLSRNKAATVKNKKNVG